MNNQFQNAYVDALLADASYVDILDLSNPVGVLTPRVTQAQAQFINANFEVRDQQLSPNGGFDAVVWRGKSGTPFAGKSYVSMRGTQGGQDLVDDSTLAARGIPHQQVADMVNWWLTLSGPPWLATCRNWRRTSPNSTIPCVVLLMWGISDKTAEQVAGRATASLTLTYGASPPD